MLSRIFLVLILSAYTFALHVYLSNGDVKCFYEHLEPKNLLWAKFETALVSDKIVSNPGVEFNLNVTVDETFDNGHTALRQRLTFVDEIVFTALESGEHRICLRSSIPNPDYKLWVKLNFDISTLRLPEVENAQKAIDARDRVGRLITRLESLRNNQRAIKASEKAAEDYSNFVHSRVLFCSLLQFAVLTISFAVQFRVLKKFSWHRH
ncbi:Erp5p LALA0_S01e16336g [Lachancea lanzarotensis]|uniref:LALA0S01e16336g1_1 n=1 Tax=Lachancea lanzarotensis TaxID=1245769 RepID=A0A0C7MYP7_9SACH|nr:uncharacterized protein LALA0_S01e16336g [Lachancea lanzarotensis]CEP60672.1 LALA0S01e16336g1_1 [Lachancea lanzarotensis]